MVYPLHAVKSEFLYSVPCFKRLGQIFQNYIQIHALEKTKILKEFLFFLKVYKFLYFKVKVDQKSITRIL